MEMRNAGRPDCYTCKRRRIKCDRKSPSCQKCINKGLTCPGYGRRLRWAGGPAFRGQLSHLRSSTSTGVESVTHQLPKLPASMQSSTSHLLGKDTLRKLYKYWDENLAGLMVWVDAEDNPYRVYILPLAHSNPAIGMAMAALSSQHASIFDMEASFSEKARNEAVMMITAHIEDVTSNITHGRELRQTLDENSVVWILAAMLLLSCYEMAKSGVEAAEYHRRAARSLINTFETAKQGESVSYQFLRNQLSLHDVFACTTSFNSTSMQDTILPNVEDESILFSRYMGYLHDITLISRALHDPESQCQRLGLDYHHIQEQFELARGQTLMTAGKLGLRPASRSRDLIRMTSIYHYAALLYSLRCLKLGVVEKRQALLEDLFHLVSRLEAVHEWLHILAWPLFIAGVESRSEPSTHASLSNLYDRIADKMGFRNFREAFDFVQDHWAGPDDDWTVEARRREEGGLPIQLV